MYDRFELPMTDNYLDKLINDLDSRKKAIRQDAEITLIDSGNGKVMQRLKRELELKSNSEKVRERAAYILGRREDPNAEAILIKSLKDKSRKVKLQACRSLGYIGNVNSLDALKPIAEGRSLELGIEAKKSMERIMDRRYKKRKMITSRLDPAHELPTTDEIVRNRKRFMTEASELMKRLKKIRKEMKSDRKKMRRTRA